MHATPVNGRSLLIAVTIEPPSLKNTPFITPPDGRLFAAAQRYWRYAYARFTSRRRRRHRLIAIA